jgi:hypothetical protein
MTMQTTNSKKTPAVPKTTKSKPIDSAAVSVVLHGHEEAVDEMYEDYMEAREAEARLAKERAPVEAAATKFREEQEKKGTFTKNILLTSAGDHDACFTYKDAFANIDTSVEADLKRLLGANYDKLFTRERTVAVKKGAMAKLEALAKQHGFEDLIETDEFIAPVAEFRETRAGLRHQMTDEINKALDSVVKQTASKPSLTWK